MGRIFLDNIRFVKEKDRDVRGYLSNLSRPFNAAPSFEDYWVNMKFATTVLHIPVPVSIKIAGAL